MTDEIVAAAKIIESLPFLEDVSDFPLLLQYGEDDPLIPVADIRALYGQIRENYAHPDLISLLTYPHVGHEAPPPMLAQAFAWFKRCLLAT